MSITCTEFLSMFQVSSSTQVPLGSHWLLFITMKIKIICPGHRRAASVHVVLTVSRGHGKSTRLRVEVVATNYYPSVSSLTNFKKLGIQEFSLQLPRVIFHLRSHYNLSSGLVYIQLPKQTMTSMTPCLKHHSTSSCQCVG